MKVKLKFKFVYEYLGERVATVFVETSKMELPQVQCLLDGWKCIPLDNEELLLESALESIIK